MTRLRSRLPGTTTLILVALAAVACGGGEKKSAGPAGESKKVEITPTADARADARTYLAQLCPKPIGGELNFMVWEGYTDTLFTKPFEEACGVKVNATYMGSSDDLVAKLRAGGAETIDLISPSSDAATAIIDAGLAGPLDLGRIPSYNDLSEGFRSLKVARKGDAVYGEPWAFGPNPLIYDTTKVRPRLRTPGASSGTESTATSSRFRTTSPPSIWWRSTWVWMTPTTRASSTISQRRGAGQGEGQDARAPAQRAEVLGHRR